ncbi:MAG: hypothetical protein AAGI38_15145 [Bacteroidota bacterium]
MKQFFSLSVTGAMMCMLFFAAACTGLEDGPAISFTKAEEKIAGTWFIEEAVLNNVEVTEAFTGDILTFDEEGVFSRLDASRVVSFPPFFVIDTVESIGRGDWDFLENKRNIELFYTYLYRDEIDTTILFREEVYEQWEITRLTEDEFWVKNDSVSLKFEPL